MTLKIKCLLTIWNSVIDLWTTIINLNLNNGYHSQSLHTWQSENWTKYQDKYVKILRKVNKKIFDNIK